MGRLSFKDAVNLVPDDMPDGAFWAMAHEMAGLEYGDGFDELFTTDDFDPEPARDARPLEERLPFKCQSCNRRFGTHAGMIQHAKVKRHKR